MYELVVLTSSRKSGDTFQFYSLLPDPKQFFSTVVRLAPLQGLMIRLWQKALSREPRLQGPTPTRANYRQTLEKKGPKNSRGSARFRSKLENRHTRLSCNYMLGEVSSCKAQSMVGLLRCQCDLDYVNDFFFCGTIQFIIRFVSSQCICRKTWYPIV